MDIVKEKERERERDYVAISVAQRDIARLFSVRRSKASISIDVKIIP